MEGKEWQDMGKEGEQESMKGKEGEGKVKGKNM